jgi:Rad52/22 family double-strand break repair protein
MRSAGGGVNRQLMTAPFAEEELRTFEGRGGKTMTFIEDETVMDRLDAGYGYGNWQLQVEEARIDGVVKVRLGVRENGEWAWYEDFGYPNQKGGDELKEAVSDGIRRCGRYLGIARDLYRKSTYEPGGALARKMPERRTDAESLEILGLKRIAGTVAKGGSDRYQCEFFQSPSGHVIGFRLERDGEDKAIPQVLVEGDLGEALFLALGGDSAALLGQHVTVKGKLYNVRQEKRRGFYRLVCDGIETPEFVLPAVVSPLRSEDEPEPLAPGQEPLFDLVESARLDAEEAARA